MKSFLSGIMALMVSSTSLLGSPGAAPLLDTVPTPPQHGNSGTFIMLTKVTLVEPEIYLLLKKPQDIAVVENLVSNLKLSEYQGDPPTGGSMIEVLMVKDGKGKLYSFLSYGLVRISPNSSNGAWYAPPENAFGTLNQFFLAKSNAV